MLELGLGSRQTADWNPPPLWLAGTVTTAAFSQQQNCVPEFVQMYSDSAAKHKIENVT